MKHVDFLFVYENKNRELENICLLAVELERRGYSVSMIETWHAWNHQVPIIDADVIVVSAFYNDSTVDFMASHVWKMKKVVNLQWEQVFSTPKENNPNISLAIQGKAKSAMHICWGNKTKQRLINLYGVNPSHTSITGHIALDFFRPELEGYYLTKRELEKKYPEIKEKKVYLFISSFTRVGIPDKLLHSSLYTGTGVDVDRQRDIQIESQKNILDWFEKILPEHEDIIFIYRPHPSEVNGELLNRIASKIPNFTIIQDESVQQWIVVSDKIYTNISTSIAQVYAAKKSCTILRPLKLPQEYDISVYEGCRSIQSFEEFRADFESTDTVFPICGEKLEEYYYIDKTKPSYIKVCDTIESVLADDRFLIESKTRWKKIAYYPLKIIIKSFHCILGKAYGNKFFKSIICRSKRLKSMGEFDARSVYLEKKNYSSDKELQAVRQKIKMVISK